MANNHIKALMLQVKYKPKPYRGTIPHLTRMTVIFLKMKKIVNVSENGGNRKLHILLVKI